MAELFETVSRPAAAKREKHQHTQLVSIPTQNLVYYGNGIFGELLRPETARPLSRPPARAEVLKSSDGPQWARVSAIPVPDEGETLHPPPARPSGYKAIASEILPPPFSRKRCPAQSASCLRGIGSAVYIDRKSVQGEILDPPSPQSLPHGYGTRSEILSLPERRARSAPPDIGLPIGAKNLAEIILAAKSSGRAKLSRPYGKGTLYQQSVGRGLVPRPTRNEWISGDRPAEPRQEAPASIAKPQSRCSSPNHLSLHDLRCNGPQARVAATRSETRFSGAVRVESIPAPPQVRPTKRIGIAKPQFSWNEPPEPANDRFERTRVVTPEGVNIPPPGDSGSGGSGSYATKTLIPGYYPRFSLEEVIQQLKSKSVKFKGKSFKFITNIWKAIDDSDIDIDTDANLVIVLVEGRLLDSEVKCLPRNKPMEAYYKAVYQKLFGGWDYSIIPHLTELRSAINNTVDDFYWKAKTRQAALLRASVLRCDISISEAGSRHLDGLMVLELRKFFKEVKKNYPNFRGVILVGAFPEAMIARSFGGVVDGKRFRCDEILAFRSDLPLADLDGSWDAQDVYRESVKDETGIELNITEDGASSVFELEGEEITWRDEYKDNASDIEDVFYLDDCDFSQADREMGANDLCGLKWDINSATYKLTPGKTSEPRESLLFRVSRDKGAPYYDDYGWRSPDGKTWSKTTEMIVGARRKVSYHPERQNDSTDGLDIYKQPKYYEEGPYYTSERYVKINLTGEKTIENPLAYPEIIVSRINAHNIAWSLNQKGKFLSWYGVNPLWPFDINYFSSKKDRPPDYISQDPYLERHLIQDYLSRDLDYRSGSLTSPDLRIATGVAQEKEGEGTFGPADFSYSFSECWRDQSTVANKPTCVPIEASSGPFEGTYLCPQGIMKEISINGNDKYFYLPFFGWNKQNAKDFVGWLNYPWIIKSLVIHGWFTKMYYNGIWTFFDFRSIYQKKYLYDVNTGSFFFSTSSYGNAPIWAGEPYYSYRYGWSNPAECLLFYGMGLGVFARAHSYHGHFERDMAYKFGFHDINTVDWTLANHRMVGECWRARFDVVRTWNGQESEDRYRKNCYRYGVLGDWTLRVNEVPKDRLPKS
jgi:hypothetical protein